MSTRGVLQRARVSGCAALALSLVLALLISAPAGAATQAVEDADGFARQSAPRVDPDTLLIKLASASGQQRQLTASRLEASGVELQGRIGATDWQLARVPAGSALRRLSTVTALPGVTQVSVNHIRSITALPNDPRLGEQGYLRTLRLPEAWDVVRAKATIDIAVLDTGVDLDHPDLAGGLAPGYDLVNADSDPSDDHGHGTMVAGVAAARTNNARGISGAAWGARVMPVKVLSAAGKGSDAVVAEAIDWATDHGAEIINLSLGGPGYNPVLAEAVRRALARGVLVVAAAGNTGLAGDFYPAALPGVVAVGATDTAGRLTSFSSHGDWVDVAAPGWSILSTARGVSELYLAGSGTSFAAPLVSGVAALMQTRSPGLSPAQLLGRLTRTARDVGPVGVDPYYGAGLVDAAAAVGGVRDIAARPAEPPEAGEPNDVPFVATPLTTGATLAELVPEGDVDWYRYDADEPGWVTVSVTPPAAASDDGRALDAMIEVYDADLRLLVEADRTSRGQVERVDAPLTRAGRYYVSVRNYHGSASPGRYGLSVLPAAEQPPLTASPKGGAWVVDADPLPGATDVAVDTQLSVTVGRSLDSVSVAPATVRLLDGVTGRPVPAPVAYLPTEGRLVLRPSAALRADRPYAVVVDGLRDSSGVRMPRAFRAPFTTAKGAVHPVETHLALTAGATLVAFPRSTRLTGRLTLAHGAALAGHPLVVQARAPGGRYRRLARLRTDATGNVAAQVRPRARTAYRLVFPGSPSLKAATSTARVVRVRPLLTARAGARVAPGRQVVVRGAMRPARTGKRVVLQRRSAGRWRAARSGRLSPTGRYALAVRAPPRAGRSVLRVVSPRDALHEQAIRLIRVVVR